MLPELNLSQHETRYQVTIAKGKKHTSKRPETWVFQMRNVKEKRLQRADNGKYPFQ
jgi:hypothetical protein